jgi:tetratricopeptide (TPR) repeat protein
MTTLRRIMPVVGMLLVGFATGCSNLPVVVPVYKPPEAELTDIRTIEVENFSVAESVAKQSGENVSGPLKNELQKTKRFQVVDRVNLDRVRELKAAQAEGLVTPASTSNSSNSKPISPDAVLRGNVVAYKCVVEQALSGARESEVVHQIVYDPITYSATQLLRKIKGFRQEELVSLEASVALTFQLVDTRTGLVRSSGEAMHSRRQLYWKPLANGGEQERLLRSLLQECVTDVVNKLTCHQQLEPVRLLEGSARVNEGITAAKSGDWQVARQAWEKAIEADPNDHIALYNLGHAYRATLEPEKSLNYFRKAYAIKSEPIYRNLIELAETEQTAGQLRELELLNGTAIVNRGITLARYGQWLEAERVWREALEQDPNNYPAARNLSLVRKQQGDQVEAAKYAALADKLQPKGDVKQVDEKSLPKP